jgi:hypothetical protein
VRKLALLLGLVAVLAAGGAASASAAPLHQILCGPECDPGGGYTGCKSVDASHSSGQWPIYSISHVLRVSYCKRNGVITSIGISAHYCDVNGLVSCSPTAAWQTGGGVGATWATFEAHATWTVTPLGIYNNTDVLGLTVPTIDG